MICYLHQDKWEYYQFKKFNDNQFEDLNNFEPFYLKDFIGTKWNATQ